MFSSVRNFLSRHKRKFIVTGALIGGTALALQYAQRKLREFQENQAREFIARQRRTQHFEMTERTCNQAIMGVATPLCDELLKTLNTEPVLQQLRSRPDNKQELWHELKVLAFARLATMVYACSMLVVSLRIQLNILGGYLYRESVAVQGAPRTQQQQQQQHRLTNHMQQTYLSLNQHFLSAGIERMARLIEAKVRAVLGDFDLQRELSLADVEQIFWSIQRAVNSDETDPSGNMAKFILPAALPDEATDGDGEVMRRMFAETLDMLESEDAVSLNTYNVTRGFSIVMDSVAEFYYEPLQKQNGLAAVLLANGDAAGSGGSNGMSNGGAQVVDITELSNANSTPITKADLNVATNINHVRVPLAKLIPIVNGLAGKAFNASVKPPSLSTSLVTLFLVSDKVKTLGANVYEVFSQ